MITQPPQIHATNGLMWMRTIQALKSAAPDLVVLPGHDIEAVMAKNARTGVIRAFLGHQPPEKN